MSIFEEYEAFNGNITHNAIFISHNATSCDVILVFKVLIKTLKYEICKFLSEFAVL